MVTDETTNNAPVLIYLKVPAQTIAELTARYEAGGEFGWYAWVEELKNFAYWDVDTEQWKEVNPQVYETYNSISNTDFVKGVGKKWSFQTIKTALYNYIYPLVQALHLTHTSRTDNPHSVTKAQVGLGNVDNTSDVNKPVSTAQKAYVDAETEARVLGDQTLTDSLAETEQSLRDSIDAVGSGSPKGAYANEAALKAANPDHTYTYVTIDTGKWYYWDTVLEDWEIGGDYQAALEVVDTLGDSETQVVNQNTVSNEIYLRAKYQDLLDNKAVIYEAAESEYAGTNNSISQGSGFQFKADRAYKFNNIEIKASRNSVASGEVIIKLFKGTSTSGLSNPTANYTLLETITATIAGTSGYDTLKSIDLADAYDLAKDDYLFILMWATPGVQIKTWNASGTGRLKYLYTLNNDVNAAFSAAWTIIATEYYTTPIKLNLNLPFVLPEDLENFATKAELEEKIDYTIALEGGENVYTHPRGEAEYAGDNTYGSLSSVGYKMKMAVATRFNQITLMLGAASATTAYIKIYKGTVVGTSTPDSNANWTLLATTTKELTSEVKEVEILLTSVLSLQVNEYLIVLISSKSATKLVIGRWSVDTYTDRNKMYYSVSTNYENIFSQTWYVGDAGYWTTPMKLDISLPFIKKTEIAEYIPENISEAFLPRITIPAKIYAVVGFEVNLWYDALIIGADNGINGLKNCVVEIVCEVGVQKARCYKINPVSANVGDHTLTITVFDLNNNTLESKQTTLSVIAATAPSAVKNCLMIGDSLTEGVTITQTVQENFATLVNNIPLFKGFIGDDPYKRQAIGGWRFQDFAGAGPNYFKFTVSGLNGVSQGAVYSNNSSNFQVQEVNITGGAGYIKCLRSSGSNNPSASGTLTKVSGSGDSTIAFSAYVSEAGNPLWNVGTSALDIANYRSNLGMGSNKFDVVTLQLGINESLISTLTAGAVTTIINYAKSIIDAFLADNANTKIIVMLPSTDGNTYGGWGANYGAAKSKVEYQKGMWLIREKIISEFDLSAYDVNVSVGIAGLVCDRFYGYNLSDVAISSRVATTEKVHTNAVHPTTSGYQQMGDAIFCQMLNEINN